MSAALSLPFEDAPTEPADAPPVALLRGALALISGTATYDVVFALAASDATGGRRAATDPLAVRFGFIGALDGAAVRAGIKLESPEFAQAQIALCRALGVEPAKGAIPDLVLDGAGTAWYHAHGRNWPSTRQARELLTAAIEIARRTA